jgi:hypothetical protein
MLLDPSFLHEQKHRLSPDPHRTLREDANSQQGKHKKYHGNHQEQTEEDSSDGSSAACHTGETEQTCDDRYDERNESPL